MYFNQKRLLPSGSEHLHYKFPLLPPPFFWFRASCVKQCKIKFIGRKKRSVIFEGVISSGISICL